MTKENAMNPYNLGTFFNKKSKAVAFSVYSKNATRLELCLFTQPQGVDEIERMAMVRAPSDIWEVEVPWSRLQAHGFIDVVYYGFRAWGPNWVYDPAWSKGTEIGFQCDVDHAGHRFNPNKLLLDPYAREISHDPPPRRSRIDPNEYHDDFYTGAGKRHIDTARSAPKSLFLKKTARVSFGHKPRRALKDDIIYEVHVRGFTRQDESIPAPLRGTFKAAGLKAKYLKDLGVTAVEFLPVQQFASEQNDDGDQRGDNYWGYMTLGYFAPNRRYAADTSPGGPTREFKGMVKALHAVGIKVFIDVVYNHTGEGLLKRATEDGNSRQDDARQFADQACLLSFRGLDNASYYTLRSRTDLDGQTNHRYQDNSACGGSLNVTHAMVRDFILDSLQYWSNEMGVDGFRFDLAPVLGNSCAEGGFMFERDDPHNVLNRTVRELPLRDPVTLAGVDLIAEPWATGSGTTYQLGRFPDGWAEWNDQYRIIMRQAANKLHVAPVAPWQVANALAGSDQQFRNNMPRSDPRPFNSINYLVSHDGYCLRDLFSYTAQDDSWDHGGDRAAQRQAVRTALAVLMLSVGVPMFTGGDELFRSLDGRENTVAVDDESVYLAWDHLHRYANALNSRDKTQLAQLLQEDDIRTYLFARRMLRFRHQYAVLRPEQYFTGAYASQNGLKDITWYRPDGHEFNGNDWGNQDIHCVAFRLDNQAYHQATGVAALYAAYNYDDQDVRLALSFNLPRHRWYRVADTAAWMEPLGNFDGGDTVLDGSYDLHARSVLILIEKEHG